MTAVTDTQTPLVHTHTHTHTPRSPDFGWIDGWEEEEGRAGVVVVVGGAEIYNLLKRMRPSGIFSKWPLFALGLGESG